MNRSEKRDSTAATVKPHAWLDPGAIPFGPARRVSQTRRCALTATHPVRKGHISLRTCRVKTKAPLDFSGLRAATSAARLPYPAPAPREALELAEPSEGIPGPPAECPLGLGEFGPSGGIPSSNQTCHDHDYGGAEGVAQRLLKRPERQHRRCSGRRNHPTGKFPSWF